MKIFSSDASNVVLSLLAGFGLAFFAVHVWPELLDTNPWWWFVVAALALAKPVFNLLGIKTS